MEFVSSVKAAVQFEMKQQKQDIVITRWVFLVCNLLQAAALQTKQDIVKQAKDSATGMDMVTTKSVSGVDMATEEDTVAGMAMGKAMTRKNRWTRARKSGA